MQFYAKKSLEKELMGKKVVGYLDILTRVMLVYRWLLLMVAIENYILSIYTSIQFLLSIGYVHSQS